MGGWHGCSLASLLCQANTLGYGFDDGPNCGHNVFYDFLTAQNQKASACYFLLLTSWVQDAG